jgi:hypothetical protein
MRHRQAVGDWSYRQRQQIALSDCSWRTQRNQRFGAVSISQYYHQLVYSRNQ